MQLAQLFQDERFGQLAGQHCAAYAKAEPFPHTVIDDFLPTTICDQLLAEFPSTDQADWLRFEKPHSNKLATREGT